MQAVQNLLLVQAYNIKLFLKTCMTVIVIIAENRDPATEVSKYYILVSCQSEFRSSIDAVL